MAETTPSAPFAKSPNAISLNFDALYEAGIPISDINKSVANEIGFDYDKYLSDGGNPNDFTYVYTNVAPKGSLTQFTDRLLKGVTEMGPAAAGLFKGVKYSSKIPVGQPLTTMAGGAAGFIGGLMAGEKASEALPFETRPPFPQDRFLAKTGEVLGENLPFVAASPFLPAKDARSVAGFLVSKNIDKLPPLFGKILKGTGKGFQAFEKSLSEAGQAARGQKGLGAQAAFYGTELTSSLGAGLGAGTAEVFAPGSEGAQFGAEVLGGTALANTPTGIFLRSVPKFINMLKGEAGVSARETKLGQKLYGKLVESGEDPVEIINRLENDPAEMAAFAADLEIDMPELTPAQITGSPLLSQLQNAIAQKGPEKVSAEIATRMDNGFYFIERLATALENQGDPGSMKMAVELREQAFQDVMELNFQIANEQALASAAKLGKAEDFDIIGKNLEANINQIIKNANAQESKLYDAIDTKKVITLSTLPNEVQRIKDKYLVPSQGFPNTIEAELKRLQGVSGQRIVDTEPKAVIAARSAIENIPLLQKESYNNFLARINDPEKLRIMGIEPPSGFVGEALRADDDVKVLQALDAYRKRIGRGLSSNLKTELSNVEKVANANLKLKRLQKEVSPTEVPESQQEIVFGDIKKLRSIVLDEARKAYDAGDLTMSKALGDLGNSLLDELDASMAGDKAYDTARAFSRAKNDSIRRTFLGDLMERDADGADKIPPELIPKYLFNGGYAPTALKTRQIIDSGTFVQEKLNELEVDPELRIAIDDVDLGPVDQRDLTQNLAAAVQLAAKQIIDPDTGRVKPQAASKFLEDNSKLLEDFPQIREMIEDGRQLENAVKLLQTRTGDLKKTLASNSVLARVIQYENPSLAVSEALGSKNPYEQLTALSQTIKNASTNKEIRDKLVEEGYEPDELMSGFKSSLIDWLFTKSGGMGQKFSYSAAKESMFGPMVKGPTIKPSTGRSVRTAEAAQELGSSAKQRSSLATLLKREGVFSQAELDRLEYILDQGAKLQVAESAGRMPQDMIDEMNMFVGALVKIAGSSGMTSIARTIGLRPQGIVEAGIGAKMADNLYNKIPANLQVNMLEKAVTDPEFLVKLLKSTKSEKEAIEATKQLNTYLFGAGFRLLEQEEGVETPAPRQEVEPVSQVSPPRPSAVETSAPPIMNAPSSAQIVQAQTPSPQPSPQVRSRMAAAFPSDGIMGLLGAS